MKKIALILAYVFAFSYSGCYLDEKVNIGWSSHTILCVNGIKYFEFDRGVAPLYSNNKKLISCSCNK